MNGRRQTGADEERWWEKALSQVLWFVESCDVSVRPLMVEREIQAQVTPGLLLVGRIDRVDRLPGGGLHVIDYKTGIPPEEPDWLQLELYALALSLRVRREPVVRVSYLFLGTHCQESKDISPGDLRQARWELMSVARKIKRAKAFSPSPGPWCSFCEFTSICRAAKPALDETEPQLALWDYWEDT